MKWKFAFGIKQNRSYSTFQQLVHFYFPFISSSEQKNAHLSYIFVETKVPCCTHWRGKQKYRITNVGVKSKIVTFATKWTKLNINYKNKFKTILTNGNCKLFLGLERKSKHETYTLLRLWLIKFLSAHILQRRKGLVDYQGRERHGWGPMWLLYQSHKLHSALSEIVSLVEI